ncbi:MAG: chloride channel protein [Thermostichales cyanobacterium SZTDM-1c_bins_54]
MTSHPHDHTPLLLATLVGLGSGALVLLFRLGIHWSEHLLTTLPLPPFGIPILGGIGVAVLMAVQQGLKTWRVPPTWMRLGRIFYSLMGSALSLAAGASLGPEGPSVELGSSTGSLIAHALGLSAQRVTLLIGAGAAAGLAAGFNAPIAGVFLAVELVLPQGMTTASVSVVVWAAVVSAWVASLGLGSSPAFGVPAYEAPALWEVPWYLGLGVAACGVAVVFSGLLGWMRRCWRALPLPTILKPVLGGLILAWAGLSAPLALGIGYETVESLLQGIPFSRGELGHLLGMKLLLTSLSQGSGFLGGIFAPAIYLGAVLGSLYGQVVGGWVAVTAAPAFAMVGMAAVLAGTVRAPLTAILLLFEMTRDYRVVLPLMAAVGLCVWLRERIPVPPVYVPPTIWALNREPVRQSGQSESPAPTPPNWWLGLDSPRESVPEAE